MDSEKKKVEMAKMSERVKGRYKKGNARVKGRGRKRIHLKKATGKWE